MQFRVDGDDSRLPPEYRTVLYRIAQEALTNIAKHAEATSAEVILLVEPSQVRLDVSDDGRGFDPHWWHNWRPTARPSWGLVGIREQGPASGRRAALTLPWAPAPICR